jgi:DNA-binding transcriptional ArsR family regulator
MILLVLLVIPFSFSLQGLLPRLTLSFGNSNGTAYHDPRFKRLLWYLIGSTKGGANRARIIDLINSHPANANQIASELTLDYKTVLHHIKALSDNGLIVTENKESYGATYFLTPIMEKNFEAFKEILAKIGKK